MTPKDKLTKAMHDAHDKHLEELIAKVEADAIQRTEEELADGLTAAHMHGYAQGKTDGIQRTRQVCRDRFLELAIDDEEISFEDAAEICMTVEVK